MRRVIQVPRFLIEGAMVVAALVFADPTALSIRIGLSLAVAGLGLRLWTAGFGYSARQRLIAVGPKRLIRHPYFAGSSLMIFGIVLAAGQSIVGLIAIPLLTWTYGLSAVREERRSQTHRLEVPGFLPELAWANKSSSPVQSFSWREALLRGRYREIQALFGLILVWLYLTYQKQYSWLAYGAVVGAGILLIARYAAAKTWNRDPKKRIKASAN